jgi:hypothetical protein
MNPPADSATAGMVLMTRWPSLLSLDSCRSPCAAKSFCPVPRANIPTLMFNSTQAAIEQRDRRITFDRFDVK